MKAICLLPLIITFLSFPLSIWADAVTTASPVDASTGILVAPDGESSATLQAPMDAFPDAISCTIMPSLDLGRVDVGMGFLVQETTISSFSAYGVGMMFTFKSPGG